MQQLLFPKSEHNKWTQLMKSLEVELLNGKKHKIVKPKQIKK